MHDRRWAWVCNHTVETCTPQHKLGLGPWRGFPHIPVHWRGQTWEPGVWSFLRQVGDKARHSSPSTCFPQQARSMEDIPLRAEHSSTVEGPHCMPSPGDGEPQALPWGLRMAGTALSWVLALSPASPMMLQAGFPWTPCAHCPSLCSKYPHSPCRCSGPGSDTIQPSCTARCLSQVPEENTIPQEHESPWPQPQNRPHGALTQPE